ncbi:PRTRC system protein A [Noviherbaspirillum sp. ST9]|uniref:PRTRC system protein A n=1 Tax=Noviherbaspirillum sp. ST9 TaxID=3401606 RepID=UPI003B5892AD
MRGDPRDNALQSTCPVVAAPRYGSLPDMQNGQRVVIAANGVFVQVKLDWLDCMLRIAELPAAPPLPYGTVKTRIAFAFGAIPVCLLEAFVAAGRMRLPNEIAGGLIYSRRSGTLRLQVYDALQASPDGIAFRMPPLDEDESIAIDLHTHGRSRAFWSPIDNGDDRGIKVAGVFGHLHRDKPSAAFRLAVNGFYQPLRHPWEESEPTSDGLAAGPRRSILNWLDWEGGQIWNM